MKTVRDIAQLKGKKVLLRGSFNVPVEEGTVSNDFRLKKTKLTIDFLRDAGARTILVGHIADTGGETLVPVYEYFKKHMPIAFASDVLSRETHKKIEELEDGDVLLCENLRMHAGEKNNDDAFAKKLASLAEVYVNDAFAASHREHASLVGVPKYLESFAGIQFEREVRHLQAALHPPSPYLFMIGGIKFSTKIPLIKKMLGIADGVFVGGALANEFFKEKGYHMDASITSGEDYGLSDYAFHEKLLLPLDVRGEGFEKAPSELQSGEKILDAGPETVKMLEGEIQKSAFVLWNGPIGDYEVGYGKHNEALARILAASDAESVVGGGDTIASIATLHLEDTFTFVSTAGGAMIQFLSDGTLPGIKALETSH